MSVRRVMPHVFPAAPAETRDFYVDVFGFDVAMDMGWITTLVSPGNATAQLSIGTPDADPKPAISIEVDDVDAVHARVLERDWEIAYSLRDEEWGVRRFMVRDPGGTLINVLSHRAG